jgi:transposase
MLVFLSPPIDLEMVAPPHQTPRRSILQVDGYAAYTQLADPTREGGPVTLVYCWSHVRRKFYEVYVGGNAPIATEALARIKPLYDIEDEIRGRRPRCGEQCARRSRSLSSRR